MRSSAVILPGREEGPRMNKTRYKQRKRRYLRFQWACRRLCSRALKWGILSYAFVGVYGTLYGSEPALVHNLGTTLVALCAGGLGLFLSFFVLTKIVAVATAWQYRRRRVEHG